MIFFTFQGSVSDVFRFVIFFLYFPLLIVQLVFSAFIDGGANLYQVNSDEVCKTIIKFTIIKKNYNMHIQKILIYLNNTGMKFQSPRTVLNGYHSHILFYLKNNEKFMVVFSFLMQ